MSAASRARAWWQRAGWHLGLAVTAALMLLPALLAVLASFKPANDLYDASPLPTSPTLGNYRTAIGEFPVARLLADTLAMAAGVVFLQLLVAVLAAYALVRFSTRAGRLLLTAGSVAVLVPAQALIIPQFLIITHLGWQNTFAGLIVPQLAGCGVPLLLLRNQAQAIPASLIEAAVLDGAGSWQTLWHVVLPVLRPALGAVAVLVFVNTWNEYLWPLIAAPGGSPGTIQDGLALFLNTEGASPGPLLAAATLATLPVLAAYMFTARRVTSAFMHSGIS
ncbi:MAG TPA: carbohydrate ABC transporter permease [Trebonia sp.]|nr:carbohydrate ABC transporter permease [Trebonia sp.]